MPVRLDKTEIPGLFSTDGYIWIGGGTPEEVADLILQRVPAEGGALPAGECPAVDIKPEEPPRRRKRPPDSQFLDRIRAEIKELLESHPRLSATLLAKVRDTFRDDQRDIATISCEERSAVAIDDVLYLVTKGYLSRLDAQSDEFHTIGRLQNRSSAGCVCSPSTRNGSRDTSRRRRESLNFVLW